MNSSARRAAAMTAACAALVSMRMTGVAGATTFVETPPDAGVTPATARVVPAGTTQIDGLIAAPGDYDLFKFAVSAPVTMQIDMGNSAFDDNLILFDGAGHGLAGNDDFVGSDSEITYDLTAGVYYLAAGVNNMSAFDATNTAFITNDTGILETPTTAVLDHIGPGQAPHNLSNLPYTITLSAETGAVPEPAAGGAGLIAAAGLLARRRRERR
jgi:MYXO-CTERM domain-containing protein